jgi:hypothetical protein
MLTLDQCASYLGDLSRSGEAYSERRVDACVDGYLVGFSAETAKRRKELAEAFGEKAQISELSERMRKRILREDS